MSPSTLLNLNAPHKTPYFIQTNRCNFIKVLPLTLFNRKEGLLVCNWHLFRSNFE